MSNKKIKNSSEEEKANDDDSQPWFERTVNISQSSEFVFYANHAMEIIIRGVVRFISACV